MCHLLPYGYFCLMAVSSRDGFELTFCNENVDFVNVTASLTLGV